MAPDCEHLDQIRVTETDVRVCAQCVERGDRWVHLRLCLTCGQVGCCDSSPNRHASRHAAESGHPIVASAEPGESWRWCFVDQTLV
jgi:CPA2 family monovalent cation:H+ antiporter-2